MINKHIHAQGLPMNSLRIDLRTASSVMLALCIGMFRGNDADAQDVPRYGDVPSDSIAILSIDMDALRSHAALQYLPWEIANVACAEQFGFALDSVETADVCVGMPSPMPEVGASIRLREDIDIADLFANQPNMAAEVQVSPKDSSLRFRDMVQAPMVRLAQREPRRVLVGTQGTLRRMLSERIQTGGPTVGLVQTSPAALRIALNFNKIRDLVASAYEMAAADVPPSMQEKVQAVLMLTDNVMLEAFSGANSGLRFSLGATNEANAASLMQSINEMRIEGLQLLRENFAEEMENVQGISEPMRDSISKYADRLHVLLQSEKVWEQAGDRVDLHLEDTVLANYSTIGIMTGLLLPAVQAAREAARRTSSSNNLRQIMLSLHNYHADHNEFPARAVTSATGEPLLSWRVMILPYLEENELFHEFRLDEPWDSPHNLPLAERIPAIFSDPRHLTLPGHTSYLAPIGDQSGWGETAISLRDIRDGTSNTIAVVEVAPELAVPWTKPGDLELENHPGTSWMPPGSGSNVGFFDGSVRWLAANIDDAILVALFTTSGGEAVGLP